MLTGLAANLMLAGRSGESRPVAERAIAAARALGDRGIESRAMGILGVDLATLGDVAGGIDLLRRSLALASPADDPAAILAPTPISAPSSRWVGFVEQALEVSLAGVESTRRYGTELSFGIFLEVNAAAMLIELARYAEAADLLERNVSRALPGVSTVHLYVTMAHLAIRTGDLAAAQRHLEIAQAAAEGIEDAQFVIDLYTFRTEIALWEGDPDAAVSIAREGFDRLAQMDDAVILGQLAIPAVQAAADVAVKARTGRHAEAAAAAVEAARDVVDRYRASTARMSEPDALAEHEIGWRMALCTAELGRSSGNDDPAAWDGVRPALLARPAPFLEAYVLWRAAEAYAGRGDSASAVDRLRAAHAIASSIGASLLVGSDRALGGGCGWRSPFLLMSPPAASKSVRAMAPSMVPVRLAMSRRRCRPLTIRSGSPNASARSSPSSPRATRTGASRAICSSAKARPGSMSRTSWASSASSHGPRPLRSRFAWASVAAPGPEPPVLHRSGAPALVSPFVNDRLGVRLAK